MKKQARTTRSTRSKKPEAASKNKPVAKSRSKGKKAEQKHEQGKTQVSLERTPLYEVNIEGDKYKVKLHKNYLIEKESDIGKNIKNWVFMLSNKQKNKKLKIPKEVEFSYYPTFEFQLAGEKPEHEKCSICQFQYESKTPEQMEKQLLGHNETDLIMLKCSHIMHYECFRCLLRDQDWVRCPVCSTIFGRMVGDQPAGTMTWSVCNMTKCEGQSDCGTIIIHYNMHAGSRGDVHFPGTHRVAYLPDNKQGNQVLLLLKEAFDRKLIFTVGRSVTTGRDNQIVWNGIHHKTNLSGGAAYFAYPDPTYFDRVKLQLAAKGVY